MPSCSAVIFLAIRFANTQGFYPQCASALHEQQDQQNMHQCKNCLKKYVLHQIGI